MKLEDYLNKSHSPYHSVELAKSRLESSGYKAINMNAIENLGPGKYYIPVYDTALFALNIPTSPTNSMHIATAHTDFPTFKIKPVSAMSSIGNCKRINVEPYGGMLKRTWFDRPLGLAGAIWIRTDNPMSPERVVVDIDRPLFIIPSLAPHMDRDIESGKIDVSKELIPVYTLEDSDYDLEDIIAEETGCSKDDILSMDLSLFLCENAVSAGAKGEFILGPRIDNISSVAALTEVMANARDNADYISIACLFDNEEIGSRTKQGADSNMLKLLLDQLNIDYSRSFMISVDGAHALHPNYPEKSDVTSNVELGRGFVIKTSAAQRYATDGKLIAIIRGICAKNNIPVQIQANKSGAPGGSTLGPIASAYVPVPTADIGVPMLSMHSTYETMAATDYDSLLAFIKEIL